MAGKDTSKQADNKRRGLVNGTFHLAVGAVVTFMGSLVLSVIIEWLGIYFQWWDQPGYLHSKNSLETELGWLNDDFKNMMYSPVHFAEVFLTFSYQWVIHYLGLEWLIKQLQNSVIFDYVMSLAYEIELNAVRLAVIILSLPALLLFGLYFLIDGLTERDLRTWGLGRETSFVYHHAKNWMGPLLFTPIALYLSSPWSVHPSIFILAFAFPFGYSIWLVAMYFKKYL